MARVPFKIRKGFDVTVSGSNLVVTDNGVAINRSTPSVSGLDVNGTVKTNTLQLQSNFMVGTAAVTGSTSATVLDTAAIADFHTVKYLVAVEKADQSERQIAEVLMVIDKNANSGAGDAYISTYGVLFSGASAIATFSSDCSGDDARLIVTCTSAGCIVKAHRIATTTGAGSSASSSEVTFGLDNLDDVSLSSVSSNQVLQWNGTSWVNATLNTATTFAALTDGAGALSGNGGKFVKVNSGATALEYVSDVDTLSHATQITMNIGGSGVAKVTSAGLEPIDSNASLGTATNPWKDLYISPNSLYIDGKKFLESSSETISISADVNQNISIQTSGSGDVELDPTGTGAIQFKGNVVQEAGATFSATSGNVTFNSPIDMDSRKIVNLTTPTANTDAANKAYVDSEITSLIGGAPGALDTLNELAAALNDDADYATTITNALASKANSSDVPSSLNDLSDVSVGTPSAGQVLQYNAGAGNFQPATLSVSGSDTFTTGINIDGNATWSNNAIKFKRDSQTEMWLYHSNTGINFRNAATSSDVLTVTNWNALGVGGEASADTKNWYDSWASVQVGGHAQIGANALGGSFTALTANAYFAENGSWKYVGASQASLYRQNQGKHEWLNVGSGSADADLTFSHRMIILEDGKVGIGTTSPTHKLTVNGETFISDVTLISGSTARLEITGSDNSTLFGVHSDLSASILEVNGTGQTIFTDGNAAYPSIKFKSQDATGAGIYFRDGGANENNDALFFLPNDNETDTLVVRGNGFVGIGDQNPNNKLMVIEGSSRPIIMSWNSAATSWDSTSLNGSIPFHGYHGSSMAGIVDHSGQHSDADNSRITGLRSVGENSDGDRHTQGTIEFSHDGTAKDEKGQIQFKVNDGDDGDSPSVTAMTIKSNGYVGIGQIFATGSAPTAKLHVSGSDGTALFKVSSDSNSNIVTIDSNHISSSVNVSASAFYGDGSQLTGITSTATWSGGSVASTIRSTGQDNPTSGTGTEVAYHNTLGGLIQTLTRPYSDVNSWGNQNYHAATHKWKSYGDVVMTLTGSKLGIGTTDPSTALDVTGTVTISEDLHQNGVSRITKGGIVNCNATVSLTISNTNGRTFKIRTGFSHYGNITSYGCAYEAIHCNGGGGMTNLTPSINHSTGNAGAWSVTRVDANNITISKSAGSYDGTGRYYIIVEGADLT